MKSQLTIATPTAIAMAVAAALAAGAAHAQQGPAPAQPQAGLEEVVVTAQRRAESLQNVPVAVSAFTATQLESRQVASTIDLVRIVPNLVGHNNTGTATANTYFMRGLGSTEQIALLDPAVSTYVDDVIIPRQNANNYALFDVERLEVLRGPQGTTFGRNSTGGAINVITRKPSLEGGGFVSLGAGNFGRYTARGSVDVPFSDTVLSKFSAFWTEDDGWLRNLTNGERLNGSTNWGARLAFRFVPTDAITWDLAGEYMVSEGVYMRSIFGQRDITRTAVSTRGGTGDVINDMLFRRDLHNDTNAVGITSNVEWRTSDQLIVNFITGYRSVGQRFILDFSTPTVATTPSPFLLNNDGQYDMFSQEIKVNGDINPRLRYVAGLYYFYEDNITKAGQAFGAATGPAIAGMSCLPRLGGDTGGRISCAGVPGYSAWRDIRNDTTSYAAYAQFDVGLTDQLTAILGARWTDDTKELDLRPTAFGGMTTEDLVRLGIPTRLSDSVITPKVGLNFQPNEDLLVYVSATRGFKSGGWNSRTAYRPQEFTPMQPEKTWSYEAGVKSELFARRLRLNATVFQADTDGLQLAYTIPGPAPTPTLSVQDNAGDIRVRGVELEFAARATEWFDLYGSVGYQDGEYRRTNPRAASFCTNQGVIQGGVCVPTIPGTTSAFINAIDPTDVPSRLPDWTASLGLNFSVPAGALGGSFRFTAEGNYNSGYWTTASNARPSTLTPAALNTFAPNYLLVNLSAGFVADNERWRVLLECKNCSDEEYLTAVFGGGFYGEPRRYAGTVTFRF